MKVDESIKAAVVPVKNARKQVKIVVVEIVAHLKECRSGPAIVKMKATQLRIRAHNVVVGFL